MPAVEAETLALPRIERPDLAAAVRPVLGVVDATVTLEGEGFQVRRPFPGIDPNLTDPFLLLDHLGAVEYSPGEAKGAPDHPHRGFETVTYIMDGAIEHKDSTGGGGVITDGATQWMTAGAGIVHSEMPTHELLVRGGLFHGTQLWVNLPADKKWSPPRYQDIRGSDVLPIAADGQQTSRAPRLEILLLGGRPIRETIAFYGPFVMNTREEIIQAIADYRAGRMGVIPPTRRDA